MRMHGTRVLRGTMLPSQETVEELGDPLQALLAARARVIEFSGGRVFVDAPRAGRLYLPGSFNPLHDGHRREPCWRQIDGLC